MRGVADKQNRPSQHRHIGENIIYFELLRWGYDVAIGKPANKEEDFTGAVDYLLSEQSNNRQKADRPETCQLFVIPAEILLFSVRPS